MLKTVTVLNFLRDPSIQAIDKTPSKNFFLRCDMIHTFFV
jgi:hypothetical protein